MGYIAVQKDENLQTEVVQPHHMQDNAVENNISTQDKVKEKNCGSQRWPRK